MHAEEDIREAFKIFDVVSVARAAPLTVAAGRRRLHHQAGARLRHRQYRRADDQGGYRGGLIAYLKKVVLFAKAIHLRTVGL